MMSPFRTLVIMGLTVCAASPALGQGIGISPAAPNETDRITIRFLGDAVVPPPYAPCDYSEAASRKVTLANNVLRIEKTDEGQIIWPDGNLFGPFGPAPAHDLWAGSLVAGEYRVEFHCLARTGVDYLIATGAFSVSSAHRTREQRLNPQLYPPRPLTNYSGHWTPRDESGWGLTIQQVDSRQLAVTLFIYSADGRPVWYFCGGGAWESMFTHRASCNRFSASGFGTPIQGLAPTAPGEVVLRFSGRRTYPEEEVLGFVLPENILLADITAEGKTVTDKEFVRIR
jgi:hypothetical protein